MISTVCRCSRNILRRHIYLLEGSVDIYLRSISVSTVLQKKAHKPFIPPKIKPNLPVVNYWIGITPRQLSEVTQRDIDDVFEAMLYIPNASIYDTENSKIDNDEIIRLILKFLGMRGQRVALQKPKIVIKDSISDAVRRPPPDPSITKPRPPVVTIMGHVDHGKTTLLDTLRNTNVAQNEAGGITQHIGAFTVSLPNGVVTFLDTPGHAAFHAMRSRGASVTDIIILVVAADDLVQPQTIEAIQCAQRFNTPIIVALNKIDKAPADISALKRQLMIQGIVTTEDGGDVPIVPISALKGTNIDVLVQTLLSEAQKMDLRGDFGGLVEASVVEASTDPHRGKMTTIVVQRGTLKKGAILVAGTSFAKVRSIIDERGKPLTQCTPGEPCRIDGWRKLPSAGDLVLQVDKEKRAREVVELREKLTMQNKMADDEVVISQKAEEHRKEYVAFRDRMRQEGYRWKRRLRTGVRPKEIQETSSSEASLSIVVKGDTAGTVEALLDILATYPSHASQCALHICHWAVGPVSENDVEMAEAFNALVYAFNVDLLPDAQKLAQELEVECKRYDVIYRLIDDLKEEISERLPLKDEERFVGEAVVLQEFFATDVDSKKKVPVAGAKCIKGSLTRSSFFRVLRNDEVLFESEAVSLRHVKKEVQKIDKDTECGLMLKNAAEIRFQNGDKIVCFDRVKVPQRTQWNPGF